MTVTAVTFVTVTHFSWCQSCLGFRVGSLFVVPVVFGAVDALEHSDGIEGKRTAEHAEGDGHQRELHAAKLRCTAEYPNQR